MLGRAAAPAVPRAGLSKGCGPGRAPAPVPGRAPAAAAGPPKAGREQRGRAGGRAKRGRWARSSARAAPCEPLPEPGTDPKELCLFWTGETGGRAVRGEVTPMRAWLLQGDESSATGSATVPAGHSQRRALRERRAPQCRAKAETENLARSYLRIASVVKKRVFENCF